MSNNKSPEERAREVIREAFVLHPFRKNGFPQSYSNIDCFEVGISVGYHSRDTEIAELREALKEIVDECSIWVIPEISAHNNIYREGIDTDALTKFITKAKQLLEDGETT